MKVIEYDKKYRQDFIDFNSAWIIDNFGHLEPEDYDSCYYKDNSLRYNYEKNADYAKISAKQLVMFTRSML